MLGGGRTNKVRKSMTRDKKPSKHALKAETARIESKVFPPEVAIKRGAESFAYFYTILGFALTIETGLIAMIDPFAWWGKLVTFAIVGASTWHLILDNSRVQDRLVRMKNRYEEKFR
jgi:hypothetical protein